MDTRPQQPVETAKEGYGKQFDDFLDRAFSQINKQPALERKKDREPEADGSKSNTLLRNALEVGEAEQPVDIAQPKEPVVAVRDGEELTDKEARPRITEAGKREEGLNKLITAEELKIHDPVELIDVDGQYQGIGFGSEESAEGLSNEHPLSRLADKSLEFVSVRNGGVRLAVNSGPMKVEVVVDLETFERCFLKKGQQAQGTVGTEAPPAWEEGVKQTEVAELQDGKVVAEKPVEIPLVSVQAPEAVVATESEIAEADAPIERELENEPAVAKEVSVLAEGEVEPVPAAQAIGPDQATNKGTLTAHEKHQRAIKAEGPMISAEAEEVEEIFKPLEGDNIEVEK